MLRTAHNTTRGQHGAALGLVLFFLVISMLSATVLVNRATTGLAIASQTVHGQHAFREAEAGLDHARALFSRGRPMLDDFQDAAAGPRRCVPNWIGNGSTSVAAAYSPSASVGRSYSYTVDLCAATCAQAAVGNDIAAGSTGRLFPLTIAIDAVAKGTADNGSASEAGIMMSELMAASPCR